MACLMLVLCLSYACLMLVLCPVRCCVDHLRKLPESAEPYQQGNFGEHQLPCTTEPQQKGHIGEHLTTRTKQTRSLMGADEQQLQNGWSPAKSRSQIHQPSANETTPDDELENKQYAGSLRNHACTNCSHRYQSRRRPAKPHQSKRLN